MKYYYRVYGLNIESTIQVPELEMIDSNSNIDVRMSYGQVNQEIKDLIEEGKCSKYSKQSMWFNIKDVAIYHIYNGDTIVIQPYEGASIKQIKLYILGSVMGMILLQKNIVAIHGGGIVMNGKGCVFTGPKGSGKSTITTALRKKGYKFISDDVCSIDSNKLTINHGFGYQKLCEDTMDKFGYDVEQFEIFRGDLNKNKYIVPAFNEFIKEDIKLDSIFELSVGDVNKVEIEEIQGSQKMDKFINNIFRVEVLKYAGGIEVLYFKKCLNIVKNIKWFKVTRPRDVFSVDEQIEVISSI